MHSGQRGLYSGDPSGVFTFCTSGSQTFWPVTPKNEAVATSDTSPQVMGKMWSRTFLQDFTYYKGTVCHFGKFSHSHSCWELNEKCDAVLISLLNMRLVGLA